MTNKAHAFLLFGAVAALVPAAPAAAGDFDGSKKLLCVPVRGYHCVPSGECSEVTADEINVPQFIRVDFKRKTLSGVEAGERSTAIQNFRKADGKTIIQGAENGRGWTMVIDQSTGKMSSSISDNADGFLMFGACTPR